MSNKKKDLRIEILSYLNEENELEYYPTYGFPVEVFIISEHTKLNLLTSEHLNVANYLFFVSATDCRNIAIALKRLLFVGSYSLFDHCGWTQNSDVIPMSTTQYSTTQVNTLVGTTLISTHLDIKLTQIQLTSPALKPQSLASIFTNSVWLERENSEMFDIFYRNSTDSRRLLLDYTLKRGVLMKTNSTVSSSNYFKSYYGVNYL